jgi:hypothetical protein
MENNQHSKSGNAAANDREATSFSNSQPGQQLPGDKNRDDFDKASANPEEHSESSKPEKDNETLGTP